MFSYNKKYPIHSETMTSTFPIYCGSSFAIFSIVSLINLNLLPNYSKSLFSNPLMAALSTPITFSAPACNAYKLNIPVPHPKSNTIFPLHV